MSIRRITRRVRRFRVPVIDELRYLRSVEAAANEVADHAFDEGWLEYSQDEPASTPLRGSISELARRLRHDHYDGDGCDTPDNEQVH